MKTKISAAKNSAIRRPISGFSLIVTLSMMILLALLAVGLLSLSSTALRSSGRDNSMWIARSNARLALELAIGELQQSMGPDTRISANASILDERQQVAEEMGMITGAWNAWSPDPENPGDYDNKKSGSPEERTDANGNSRPDGGFHRWLISARSQEDLKSLDFVSNAPAGDSVVLVENPGSDPDFQRVVAQKVPVTGGEGKVTGEYAWAVLDEGQKAALNSIASENSDVTPLQSVALQSGLNWGSVEEWSMLGELQKEQQRKLITLGTLAFGGVQDAEQYGHDLTSFSSGLLTDVTRGGLKTDLSLLFAKPELPDEYLNRHIYSQDETPLIDAPASDGHAYAFPSPDPKWGILHKFHRIPEDVFNGDSENPRIDFNANPRDSSIAFRPNGFTGDESYHQDLKLAPVIAKAQFIFSVSYGNVARGFKGIRDEAKANKVDWEYIAYAQTTIEPIITLWNPYDVPMDVSDFRIFLYRMPLALHVDSTNPQFKKRAGFENSPTDFVSLLAGDALGNSTNIAYPLRITPPRGKRSVELLPGEHRIFSLADSHNASDIGNNNNNGRSLDLVPGWRTPSPGSGEEAGIVANPMHWDANWNRTASYKIGPNKWKNHTLHFLTDDYRAQEMTLRLLPSAEELDSFETLGGQRVDFYLRYGAPARDRDVTYGPGKSLEHQRLPDFGAIEFEYGDDIADVIGRIPAQDFPRFPINQGDVERGIRGGHAANDERKPFAAATLHLKSLMADDYRSKYPAKTWIHNNPNAVYARAGFSGQNEDFGAHQYELSVQPMQGDWSSNIPEIAPFGDRDQGLGGPSPSPAGGRVFAPFASLPREAPTSLAQYRHAPLNSSGKQPLQAQIVGNSFAHPLLASDKAIDQSDSYLDHSFLANQALFDGAFISTASNAGSMQASLEGGERLVNQRMRVALPAGAGTVSDYLDAGSDYERSAACLMLDGAFNVNSTSVRAWQAFLTLMNQENLPLLEDLESATVGELSNESRDPIVSRYQMPLEETLGADVGGPGGAETPAWTGFKRMTSGQIEELAVAIVKEVKSRGPFQSLGEFVNRRVEDSELANEGCLQAAINRVGVNEDAEQDQGNAFFITSAVDGQDNYVNTEVAEGSSMTGTPGWVTQADLLQTMAPYITPRSDTFRIRAYGSATDASGRVVAKAWCEAVVQRNADYVDSTDEAHVRNDQASGQSLTALNEQFGRKFNIRSFRWLSPEETALP